MVPRQGDILDGVGDGGGAGGGGQGPHAPLQGGDALLEDIRGGVPQAGIDVPLLRQSETARRLGGILEHIAGGEVQGHRPGVRCGVRLLLAHVDLQGLKAIVCHLLSFLSKKAPPGETPDLSAQLYPRGEAGSMPCRGFPGNTPLKTALSLCHNRAGNKISEYREESSWAV